ncbi:hypothetical protein CU098_003006, partial [Rhizopus stolonifer]
MSIIFTTHSMIKTANPAMAQRNDTFVHRYSRRHQPYQIPKKQQKKIETPSPSTSSLFGPSLSPSTTIVSDDSTSSLILNDSEILDDFDQFVRSPSTHFLLSPP